MEFLRSTHSATRTNAGLLLIRLVLGIIFIAHGWQKVFTYGMSGVGENFVQMGIPLGAALGPVVSLVELLGGVAILLGLFTRAAAVGVASVMVGAIVFAHLPAGFFAPNGYEFPLMLMVTAAALAVLGGGAYSADAVLERRLPHRAPAPVAAVAEAEAAVPRRRSAA